MGSPLSWTIYEPLKTLAVEKKFFSNLHFHSFYEGILLVVLRTSCWLLVGLKGGIDVLGNQTGWLFQGKPLNSLYFLYSPKFGFFKCKGEKKKICRGCFLPRGGAVVLNLFYPEVTCRPSNIDCHGFKDHFLPQDLTYLSVSLLVL